MKLLIAAFALATAIEAGTPEFAARSRQVIADSESPTTTASLSYLAISARLKEHRTPELCSRSLIKLLDAGPTGDMFWMFPVTAIAYLDQGQLSPEARVKLRGVWKTYMPYRGDTENHWLLYYSSLYLMAQKWPDQDGSQWYTGKSSRENFEEARAWIESWVKLTTRRGQGEYDSPHYVGVYLIPMSYLAEWATDPAMKQRARMMLDWLIADYAPENVDGAYVGAQSRVYEEGVIDKSSNVSSDFGWLWFGLGQPLGGAASPHYDSFMAFYVLASDYEPPEVLRQIATDRSVPYTHHERKRTRNRWRFAESLHGDVFKTTYMTKEYAVGSDQGGILQPIQQHSWDVTWRVADAKGKHNTLFTLNPHSSVRELQTYFTFARDGSVETVVRSKKQYDSPDKLVGGSPYERILQNEDALIALYDISAGARFAHVNGFISKDLQQVEEGSSGWIFGRGGDAWIALRLLQPYTWKSMAGGDRRLFSPGLRNGTVVQVAPASQFPTLAAFRDAILALPMRFDLSGSPEVWFRSLRGAEMHLRFDSPPDRSNWKLFDGPNIHAEIDGERMVIQKGQLRRVLDFRTLTVTDQ